MRILTAAQMREADRRTIEDVGIASLVLMENAGRQVVGAIESAFDQLPTMRVAILCGPGSNGGDGFVVARTMAQRGIDVGVYLVGETAHVAGDARINLSVLRALGQDVVEIADATAWELHSTDVLGSDLVVDAIFGTGFHGQISGVVETIIADLNSSARPVVAVDLPTGLSADTATVPGPAMNAVMTVTLAAPKLPLVVSPAEAFAGNLIVADIGIPAAVIENLEGPWVEVLTRDAMRSLVEPRSPDSHKGDYGRVLVIAGSSGKTGAAHLSGLAALRSGAGLVTVATPANCAPVVASLGAEYMTLPLDQTSDGLLTPDTLDRILAFEADVIAIGPGLGQSAPVADLVQGLVERSGVPLILDADALNVLAGRTDALVGREGVDIVITPHPGEMGRLVGCSVDDVQSRRLDIARAFATAHRVHVVLKGHRTVIAAPDGKTSINLTGNAGMATGGSGDVLLGMIAGWFGQLLDADAAVKLAVYLHGLAGDLAEADEGEVALIAGDIVARLGDAVSDLTARKRKAQSTTRT